MFNNPNLLISGLVLLGFSVKSGAFFLKRSLTFYVEVFILWQVMPSWVEKGVSKANISLAVLATNTWLLMHCQILLPSTWGRNRHLLSLPPPQHQSILIITSAPSEQFHVSKQIPKPSSADLAWHRETHCLNTHRWSQLVQTPKLSPGHPTNTAGPTQQDGAQWFWDVLQEAGSWTWWSSWEPSNRGNSVIPCSNPPSRPFTALLLSKSCLWAALTLHWSRLNFAAKLIEKKNAFHMPGLNFPINKAEMETEGRGLSEQ